MSKSDWRAHLQVHPAADLFPLMSEPELKELAADIKKHGLIDPVILWRDDGGLSLLDGRNRLDAMELAGISFYMTAKDLRTPDGKVLSKTHPQAVYALKTDPYAFVLSANIHRRHLTAGQKRELIAKLLKANPEQSNRKVAKQVKADHKTVAAVRRDREATGEIPRLKKTVGADGKARKQPVHWQRRVHPSAIYGPKTPVIEGGADGKKRRAPKGNAHMYPVYPAAPTTPAICVGEKFIKEVRRLLQRIAKMSADEQQYLCDQLAKVLIWSQP